jgi:hypothetical protein
MQPGRYRLGVTRDPAATDKPARRILDAHDLGIIEDELAVRLNDILELL